MNTPVKVRAFILAFVTALVLIASGIVSSAAHADDHTYVIKQMRNWGFYHETSTGPSCTVIKDHRFLSFNHGELVHVTPWSWWEVRDAGQGWTCAQVAQHHPRWNLQIKVGP